MISLQFMCLNEHNQRFYGSGDTIFEEDSQKNHQDYLQNNVKLKNQLCRNYLQYGFCRYNDKCQFAHGIDQLRQNQSFNVKYKTKQCQSFFNKGYCQYGQRCNFLHHNLNHQEKQLENKCRKIKSQFREIIEEGRVKSRFFHV